MIDVKAIKVPTFVKSYQRQIMLTVLAIGSSSVLLLSGCSSAFTHGLQGPSGETVVTQIRGKVHGGQYPVSSSTVQVYSAAIGTPAGYNAAATALGTAVTTDSNGNWTYGSFTCTSGSDELFVASTGGNPGLGGTVNNPALVLTAALGPCSTVESGDEFVFIDEVTTVATEYALAGFSSSYKNVGTSATNKIGLENAFATVNNLVNISTGQALTTTPAYATAPAGTVIDTFRSIVPFDTINSLANVLASCVNTDGVANPACSNLFAITGGSLAYVSTTVTNTADAALYIAHHPGLPASSNFENQNVANLLTLGGYTGAPFGPTLTTTPNDLTMTVNFVGGGLGGVNRFSYTSSQRLAIDASGDVLVPNPASGTVTILNNLGAPLTNSTTINLSTQKPTQIGGITGFGKPNDIAVDTNGNAWVSDSANCLEKVAISSLTFSGPFSVCTGGTISQAVAVDASNYVWVNLENGISSTDNTGTLRAGFPVLSGFDSLTGFMGADYTGHLWYIDGGGQYGALTSTGASYVRSGTQFASDQYYNAFGILPVNSTKTLSIWVPQGDGTENIQPAYADETYAGSQAALQTLIQSLPSSVYPYSEGSPAGIAADGNSYFYIVQQGGGAESVGPNITVLTDTESAVSPYSTGYTGGSAQTALESPQDVSIDQSGNLWVVNQNNFNNSTSAPAGGTYLGNGTNASNLTEFVGLAAPVNPVFAADAANGTYATKP